MPDLLAHRRLKADLTALTAFALHTLMRHFESNAAFVPYKQGLQLLDFARPKFPRGPGMFAITADQVCDAGHRLPVSKSRVVLNSAPRYVGN